MLSKEHRIKGTSKLRKAELAKAEGDWEALVILLSKEWRNCSKHR
ncbi:hypothetical protein [Cyanobium sp. LEGE 06143]|nr:hypothetical protein [Cyanobium sp. LEGE 06143]